jgi:hypothetical protein
VEAVAGLLGFGLAALGHVAGLRWLTGAGILTTGVGLVWLAVLAQRPPRQ